MCAWSLSTLRILLPGFALPFVQVTVSGGGRRLAWPPRTGSRIARSVNPARRTPLMLPIVASLSNPVSERAEERFCYRPLTVNTYVPTLFAIEAPAHTWYTPGVRSFVILPSGRPMFPSICLPASSVSVRWAKQ
jgi:hypothetical protein